jgi:hypothetical protein
LQNDRYLCFYDKKLIKSSNRDQNFKSTYIIGFGGFNNWFFRSWRYFNYSCITFFANLSYEASCRNFSFLLFYQFKLVLLRFNDGVHLDIELLLTINNGTTWFDYWDISKKIDGAKLKPAFGWFVLVMDFILSPKNFLLYKILIFYQKKASTYYYFNR